MTSRAAKEQRLKESKFKRAKALSGIDPRRDPPPPGAVVADPVELAHNNTYDLLPKFYIDRAIVCRQCGAEGVWPAARQKWWYEVAKGNINSDAVLCRSCRESRKVQPDSTLLTDTFRFALHAARGKEKRQR